MLSKLIRDVLTPAPNHSPSPDSPFNASRLPSSGVKTELVVREVPGPVTAEDLLTSGLLKWAFVLGPFAFGALPLFAAAAPASFLVMAVLLVVGVRYLVWPKTAFVPPAALSRLRGTLVVLLSFVFLASVFATNVAYAGLMLIAALVITRTSEAIMFWVPAELLKTSSGHLLADPALPQREDLATGTVAPLLFSLWVVGIGFFLFAWRNFVEPQDWTDTLWILLILWLSATVVVRSVSTPIPLAAFLTPYLFYDGRRTDAPGVWRPKWPLRDRRTLFVYFLSLAYFAIVFSLQFLSPLLGVVDPSMTPLEQGLVVFGPAVDFVQAGPISVDVLPIGRSGAPEDWLINGLFFPVLDAIRVLVNATLFTIPVGLVSWIIVYATCLPALVYVGRIQRRAKDQQVSEENTWSRYTDILRNSEASGQDSFGNHIAEKDHLFVGIEPRFGFPVLLHQSLFREHCYIVGSSGSGKTALGITPLLVQMIRRGGEAIVVLDLKGDAALFHTIQREARRQDQPFRYFTPERNARSFQFDPIGDMSSGAQSEMQLCQLLLDALSLNHGEGYGRSYYSKRSRHLLMTAMLETPRPSSLMELAERLRAYELRPRQRVEMFELLSTVDALSRYEALAPGAPDESISMSRVLSRREIAYFWLPAAVESMSVREIGKLALFSMLNAAIDRKNKGLSPVRATLVVDEFQRLAGENFKVVLEQARSFGIGVILANQSLADLRTPSADLRSTVMTNTRVKMHFAVSEPEAVDALSRASGESLSVARSWSFKATPEEHQAELHSVRNDSFSEVVRPRLSPTDIRAISDHPLQMVLEVSRGHGFSQFGGLPIPVQTMYAIPEKVFRENSEGLRPGGYVTTEPGSLHYPTQEKMAPGMVENRHAPKDIEHDAALGLNDLWNLYRAQDARGTDLVDDGSEVTANP